MSEVNRIDPGSPKYHRCLDCGGKANLKVTIDAVDIHVCEHCAEELRDKLIERVGGPEE